MATPDELNDAIAANAAGPQRVRVGNHEVEQHSLKDQLDAADRIAAQCAARKPHFGLRFTKLVPPGAG